MCTVQTHRQLASGKFGLLSLHVKDTYVVCSHLYHKRFCVCCVKRVPATPLEVCDFLEYTPVIHTDNLQFGLGEYLLRHTSKCCIQYKIQQATYLESQITEASPRLLEVNRKKCFNKHINFNRCCCVWFHGCIIPVLKLVVVLDLFCICKVSFPWQSCTTKQATDGVGRGGDRGR